MSTLLFLIPYYLRCPKSLSVLSTGGTGRIVQSFIAYDKIKNKRDDDVFSENLLQILIKLSFPKTRKSKPKKCLDESFRSHRFSKAFYLF